MQAPPVEWFGGEAPVRTVPGTRRLGVMGVTWFSTGPPEGRRRVGRTRDAIRYGTNEGEHHDRPIEDRRGRGRGARGG